MYYTIGGFTLDDTVLPTGEIEWKAPGGNALYSAIGAKIWDVPVGIITPIGEDYPQEYIDEIERQGFDVSGVCRIPYPSFHVWILHETQNRRQIIYRLDSGSNKHLDPQPGHLPDTIRNAKGVHLCPISGSSQTALMEHLLDINVPTFFDLIVIPDQINVRSGHRLELWPQLRAFLPSIEEVKALWGANLPIGELIASTKKVGPPVFAIKMGSKGCLVYDPAEEQIYHIPAYPAKVVDSTGAGDAFCGGFMVGLQETGSPVEAAMYGSVSASFVIEGFGAMHAMNIPYDEAMERKLKLKDKVFPFSGTLSEQLFFTKEE
jgi:ribokinase